MVTVQCVTTNQGKKNKGIEQSYICLYFTLQNVIIISLVVSFIQKDPLLTEILYTTYYDSNHTVSFYCYFKHQAVLLSFAILTGSKI